MRLVEVMIPAGKRDAVLAVLDDEGIDYALTDETSDREYTAVVTFPLPTGAVEPVLERLRETGIESDAYTVVLDAETVVSRRFEALRERYEADENDDRIAREELVSSARDLAPKLPTFAVMTAVSAVVATAGLLLDSPAVVVGSMVIAPLVGPAMATGVGTVVGERDLFARGVKLQLLGGLLAVASAAAFAYALRSANLVPLRATEVFAIGEVRERLLPDILSLVVALGAGVAGAFSLSSGVSSALVGVMIAVAIVPPTAVVGIGLAWGRPAAVLGSGVLVLVNFLSVNFAALLVLWYVGYRPTSLFRRDDARVETLRRVAVLGVAILLLSSVLVAVSSSTSRTASFEADTRAQAEAVAADHGDLVVLSVAVSYETRLIFRDPRRVTVVVGHPVGVPPPPVADPIAARIDGTADGSLGPQSGGEIAVEVRYVPVDTAAATG